MIENEKIKQAEEEYEYLTGTEEAKRLEFLRKKAILDERDALYRAKTEGKSEGIKEGKEKNKIEIARKMKQNGFDIEMIEKITELTKEEIEKI